MQLSTISHSLLILLLFLCLHFVHLHASSNSDMDALMAFKASSDRANRLSSWDPATDFCTWPGVSCIQGRVSRLVLEDLNLTGSLQPLASLSQLRVLSLKHNRLSGPVPDLSNLSALKLLFLSHNSLSGDFPVSVLSLFRLYRLDFSHNNFSGAIPTSVNRLYHLLTLRLEDNHFTGPISGVNLPNLQDLNVSGNLLTGFVPKPFTAFPFTAFDRNPSLCGAPLPVCKNIVSDPTQPGSDAAAAVTSPAVVSSTPSGNPTTTEAPNLPSDHEHHHHHGGKLNHLAVILIVISDVVVLALISAFLFWYFWRNLKRSKDGKRSQLQEGEKIVYSSSPYPPQGGFERGKMVFFEGMKRFELEDLLRASAEMLGKGGFGTAYKAVLEDGNVVAVKRLKDLQAAGKREFEQQMDILGRLRHPNVVSLKAYYYARDEKLLVYEYMMNGSLFSLLYGNRGPGRTPLDWTTRMKIAAGAARGLAFIHHAAVSPKLCHGNVKSTNILIDRAGNGRLSDFGLSVFASPSVAPRCNGYRAPELADGKVSQKADVFAFGVVLLEILTGKCPSTPETASGVVDLPRWVQSVVREEWTAEVFDLELMRYKDIEEEMVGMLQIALICTSASPDQRPRISQVVKMIDEIRSGGEVSPSHESFDSVSESPAVSEDASGISH